MHATVALAERFVKEKDTSPKTGVLTPDELAIERARQVPRETLVEAARIRSSFQVGSRVFGGWVGLVIGVKLISLALRRKRTDYEPDRGDCFACARCFEYCPNELVRRGIPFRRLRGRLTGCCQGISSVGTTAPSPPRRNRSHERGEFKC
jgi:NAD-dependent dihydropyrimidine dehydrogenase PreA subunit